MPITMFLISPVSMLTFLHSSQTQIKDVADGNYEYYVKFEVMVVNDG